LRKKILIIAPGILEIPTNRGGGGEEALFHYAQKSGYPVTILSPKPINKKPKKLSVNVNIEYSWVPAVKLYPVNVHSSWRSLFLSFLRQILFYIDSCFKVIKHGRDTEFLLISTKFEGILPLFVSKILHIKTIYRDGNCWPWILHTSMQKRQNIYKTQVIFGKLISKHSNMVIVTSQSIKNGMIRHGIQGKKICVIPNGVDLNVFNIEQVTKDKHPPWNILFLGRLVDIRGADMLPGIINNISVKKQRNVVFTIVGAGPRSEMLRHFVYQNKLGKKVEILGQVRHDQIPKIVKKADVALFISPFENFPSLALLECLGSGCPVVATAVGDTCLIIKQNYNGVLTLVNISNISEAIDEILDDPKKLRNMSTNAYLSVSDYSWESIVELFTKCLKKIQV